VGRKSGKARRAHRRRHTPTSVDDAALQVPQPGRHVRHRNHDGAALLARRGRQRGTGFRGEGVDGGSPAREGGRGHAAPASCRESGQGRVDGGGAGAQGGHGIGL
jgi:hypothetical protein